MTVWSLRTWMLILGMLTLSSGCSGGGLPGLGGGGNRNRNADVSIDLGTAATIRSRVIPISGTVRPDSFSDDDPGLTVPYRVRLMYSLDTDSNFQPATLLLAPGITVTNPIEFPVGSTTPFTLRWDYNADVSNDVQARVFLRLSLEQDAGGSGMGSSTKGPKEIDLRATGGCNAKSPRITNTSLVIPRNQPSTAVVPVEFGVAPFSFTINEPLQNGLFFNADGSITGTPAGPMAPILRLVTVTDNCLSRMDQAWITIAVP